MKNDYLDTEPPTATATTTPQPHLFPKLHPHFPTTATNSQIPTPTPPPPPPPPPAADGATIEVVRRPRGRPPGSKNKPKPPLVITQDPDPTSLLMAPYVLEIPPRNDIVESVTRFCRRNGLSLLLLSASGPIFNFSLRQPSTSPSSTVTFHGRFEMLSLSATFLGEGSRKVGDGVVVTVAGPQGQIVGGKVVGPLVAAGTVVVVAVSFNGPSFHRLGDEGEIEVDAEDDTRDGHGRDNAAATQTPPQQQQPGEGYGSSRLGGTESMFWGHAHSLPGRQPPRQPPPPPPF